jgi:hypothetical protein
VLLGAVLSHFSHNQLQCITHAVNSTAKTTTPTAAKFQNFRCAESIKKAFRTQPKRYKSRPARTLGRQFQGFPRDVALHHPHVYWRPATGPEQELDLNAAAADQIRFHFFGHVTDDVFDVFHADPSANAAPYLAAIFFASVTLLHRCEYSKSPFWRTITTVLVLRSYLAFMVDTKSKPGDAGLNY